MARDVKDRYQSAAEFAAALEPYAMCEQSTVLPAATSDANTESSISEFADLQLSDSRVPSKARDRQSWLWGGVGVAACLLFAGLGLLMAVEGSNPESQEVPERRPPTEDSIVADDWSELDAADWIAEAPTTEEFSKSKRIPERLLEVKTRLKELNPAWNGKISYKTNRRGEVTKFTFSGKKTRRKIVDISPVASLSELEVLNISGTRVADLTPLLAFVNT